MIPGEGTATEVKEIPRHDRGILPLSFCTTCFYNLTQVQVCAIIKLCQYIDICYQTSEPGKCRITYQALTRPAWWGGKTG